MTDMTQTLDAEKQEVTPTAEGAERTRDCQCFTPSLIFTRWTIRLWWWRMCLALKKLDRDHDREEHSDD